MSVRADHQDGIERSLLLGLEDRVLELKFLRGPLCLGDIAEIHRQTLLGGVGSYAEPGAERRVELLEIHGLVVRHRPAVFALEGGADGAGELRPEVPAGQFRASPREQPLRLAVEEGEPPLLVHGEKRIRDALECRREPLGLSVCLLLRLLAVGDVLGDACNAQKLAGVVADRKASHLDPANRAVRAHDPELELGPPRQQSMLVCLVGRYPVIRVDRLGPRFRIRVQAFAAAAPDLFVGRADVDHAIAVRSDEEERVADVIRHLAEPRLAFAQCLRSLLALGDVAKIPDASVMLAVGPGDRSGILIQYPAIV